MNYTMKLLQNLRDKTNILENQFGFMPGRSTMEGLGVLSKLIERFR